MDPQPQRPDRPLSRRAGLLLALLAVAAFHPAFLEPRLSPLVLVYLGALFSLRRLPTARSGFYTGLALGLGVFAPQLAFFWTIFGPAAAALWLILAFWHGVTVALFGSLHRRWGSAIAWLAAPVVWLGIEFFRSELYYLRFAWLTAGSVLPVSLTAPLLPWTGIYGLGALLMFLAAGLTVFLEAGRAASRRLREPLYTLGLVALAGIAVTLGALNADSTAPRRGPDGMRVAGLQLEFPGPAELMENLREFARNGPPADLLVLSEYTFDGPVPDNVRAWCRQQRRWLIAGGKEPLEGGRFYNTAYVIDTNGAIAFQHAKTVPIQFFSDGLPAPRPEVWESPWGRLGLCVCYDLNYARAIDGLVALGAKALIVPTMDVESWGRHEHHLNARLAPVRAAEYRLPVLRVASSGISQLIDARGRVTASAPTPGPGEILAGEMRWDNQVVPGRPLDRWLGPAASLLTGLLTLFFMLPAAWKRRLASTAPSSPDSDPDPVTTSNPA